MTDAQLCDIIEGVRVASSEHTDSDWKLGAVYALDTVKPLLRKALAASSDRVPPTLRQAVAEPPQMTDREEARHVASGAEPVAAPSSAPTTPEPETR